MIYSFGINRNTLLVIGTVVLLVSGVIVSIYTNPFYLILLIAPYVFFLLLKNKKIWIYFLIFYLPLETIINKIIPNQFALLLRYSIEPITILLLLFFLCQKLKTKQVNFKKFRGTLLTIFLFILISVISSIFNFVSIDIFFLGLRWFIRYVPIFILIVMLDWEIKEIKSIILLNFSLVFFENIVSIFQVVGGEKVSALLAPEVLDITDNITKSIDQGESEYAVYATFGRYSSFALFLSLWYMFIFSRFIITKKGKILLLLSTIILILTYARQAAVGVLIGIIIIAIIYKNKNLRLLVFTGSIVVISLFYIFLQNSHGFVANDISQNLYQRFFGAFTVENFKFDNQNGGRLYFLNDVSRIFLKESPLFGFGMGMYGTEPAISLNPYIYTHFGIPTTFSMDVFWVSILGQVGILGLISWLGIYILFFKRAIPLYRSTENQFVKWFTLGYLSVIPVLLVESFFSSNLNDRYQSFGFWLLSGFLIVLYNKNIITDHQYKN